MPRPRLPLLFVVAWMLSILVATSATPAASDTPLFTGDGVRSVTASSSSTSSTLDDAALQQILTRALRDEQTDAMYVLAMLKFYGQRVDRDVAGAVRLLKRLAQPPLSHRDAQFTLGVLFTGGHAAANGLPRDDRRGAVWLTASAARGHADAPWVLAELYNHGRGVPLDPTKARELLVDAAARADAHPRAVFQLGVMHEYGRGGVARDVARAAQLYGVAADQHVVDATYYLALLYATGRGVPKNSVYALELLTRAADQGYAAALLRLGEIYADGANGVAIDYAAALQFFQRATAAAAPGNDNSDTGLGHLETLARARVAELQWLLAEAETRVRAQERLLGVSLLRVQVATIEDA